MNLRPLSRRIDLESDHFATVQRRSVRQRLRVACGKVWLTIDGQPDDHVLSRGDELVLPSGTRALVQALDAPARLVLHAAPRAGAPLAAAWALLHDGARSAWVPQ